MTKTIEEAAQDHADKYFIEDAEIFYNEPWNNAKDLYAKTLADFAKYCISHQWIPVDERLPEDDSYFYLVADVRLDPLGVDCAEYTCETKLFSRNGKVLHPTHWLPIPQLNPEKE